MGRKRLGMWTCGRTEAIRRSALCCADGRSTLGLRGVFRHAAVGVGSCSPNLGFSSVQLLGQPPRKESDRKPCGSS